ncbi:hypothetical protein [Eubacterium aggregans]|uniref:hypothetical protein n=1 Tax=Eubacterium aggregans TaxID=81409 RepID=UPI003F3799D0
MEDIITVSEKDIQENVLLVMEKHKLVAETAGVVALAGLKKRAADGKKIVCVMSSGNIDTVTISSIVNQGMISRGRIMCFAVELPDKPGQLVKVASLLAENGANVIELEHNQFKALDRYANKVMLEVTVETNGHDHIDCVLAALRKTSSLSIAFIKLSIPPQKNPVGGNARSLKVWRTATPPECRQTGVARSGRG